MRAGVMVFTGPWGTKRDLCDRDVRIGHGHSQRHENAVIPSAFGIDATLESMFAERFYHLVCDVGRAWCRPSQLIGMRREAVIVVKQVRMRAGLKRELRASQCPEITSMAFARSGKSAMTDPRNWLIRSHSAGTGPFSFRKKQGPPPCGMNMKGCFTAYRW